MKDIEERHRLRGDNVTAAWVNILASAVGSLNNPAKLANTFGSNRIGVSDKNIGAYIGYLPDAFFIQQSAMPCLISGSRKKVIVVKGRTKLWRNEEGIVVMGIMDFLLNPDSLQP